MKVKMRTNLGSVHAAEIGLDYKDCLAGKVVEVSDKAATWLIETGKAELDEQKGVPSAPSMKGK